MHLLIATLFSVLLFPAAPALADGGTSPSSACRSVPPKPDVMAETCSS
ncbi:hypothetical protein [Pseudomonas sp. PSE14]|nr:hypothetical protein [Pseudomonas sp. PSE14]WEJ74123.1 hypothetical protein O6P39_09730 [Pseudomonas sp. PSE14]